MPRSVEIENALDQFVADQADMSWHVRGKQSRKLSRAGRSVPGGEFLRRFLQHVLPKGFPRIRYFGWLANRRRNKLLPLCRHLFPPLPQQTSAAPTPALWRCPRCHAPMAVLERFTPTELLDTEGRQECILDSS